MDMLLERHKKSYFITRSLRMILRVFFFFFFLSAQESLEREKNMLHL
jgi:hypothetical protein